MTSLIAGTWSLISSSAEVITGARRMTKRIQRLLQLETIEVSESDRRRLLGIQKRVECLVQPLNFLLLWSKKRDSCVQQAVLSAQELLFDVCSYVEHFVPQDGTLSIGVSGGAHHPGDGRGHLDSEKLEYYLRELEFACSSVSMAVNIARVIDAPQQPQWVPSAALQASSNDSGSGHDRGVSLSAVLRASMRIQEMSGRSGDLCACPGRLYAEASSGADEGGGTAEDDEEEGQEWVPALSLATFKVVAAVDPRRGWRRYCISIESRLPLHLRERASQPADGGESALGGGGLNAAGPVEFPIKVALEARLSTTAHMVLPTEPMRCLRDLGIDSLVLVWEGGEAVADPNALEAPAEFPDAVLLPETGGEDYGPAVAPSARPAGERVRPAAKKRDAPRRGNSSNSLAAAAAAAAAAASSPRLAPSPRGQPAGTAAAGGSSRRFAFVFDGPRGTAEPRAGEAEVALTPLDALYLARLCALDDGQHQPFAQDAGTGSGGAAEGVAACPPHLLSSDEVLVALLAAGVADGDGSPP